MTAGQQIDHQDTSRHRHHTNHHSWHPPGHNSPRPAISQSGQHLWNPDLSDQAVLPCLSLQVQIAKRQPILPQEHPPSQSVNHLHSHSANQVYSLLHKPLYSYLHIHSVSTQAHPRRLRNNHHEGTSLRPALLSQCRVSHLMYQIADGLAGDDDSFNTISQECKLSNKH